MNYMSNLLGNPPLQANTSIPSRYYMDLDIIIDHKLQITHTEYLRIELYICYYYNYNNLVLMEFQYYGVNFALEII